MTIYDKLKGNLQKAPATWIPALLRVLVETAIKKKVFRDEEGIITFVQNTIDRLAESESEDET